MPATEHQPPLADAPYVIGVGRRGRRHAVSYLHAREAMDQVAHAGPPYTPQALPVCVQLTGTVTVVARYGAFARTNPRLAAHGEPPCPTCAWAVALREGQLELELSALAVTGSDRWVLRQAGLDPDYLPGVCRAILTHASPGADEPYGEDHAVALLAHATRHAPTVFAPLTCLEGTCDHRPSLLPAGEPWHCPCTQDTSVLCTGCGLTSEPRNGELEGLSLVEVPAPCSVLAAVATTVGHPPPEGPDRGARRQALGGHR